MMNKKKNNAFTAFLITLMFIAFIIPFSLVETYARGHRPHRHRPHHPHHPHHPYHPSPLSKTIEVTFVYDITGYPNIGTGLSVELWNENGLEPISTAVTDLVGQVTFTDLKDGTYHIEYDWQGTIDITTTYIITCDEIVWSFDEIVAPWTVEKTFLYADGVTPVIGLDVTLQPSAITLTTDASGFVSFVDVIAGDYTLEWIWGGVGDSETVPTIVFSTPTPVSLANELPLKSGGGI